MFNRKRCLRPVVAVASISLVAGCSVLSDGNPDDKGPIIVGTTSAPSTLDPAASWDQSWELFRNIYQTLLNYPVGATTPQPDAAKSCRFTDSSNTVYSCELRSGLTFSDGHKLDARAVKYSIDRIRKINVNGGPAGLLGSLDSVRAVSDREVVFNLNKPDATFPFVLATPGMSIVDPEEYPDNAVRKGDSIVGSGPYDLQNYEQGKQAVLVANKRYKGFADRRNDAVTIRYFQDSHALAADLRDKKLDLSFRGLAADDVISFQRNDSKDMDVTEARATRSSTSSSTRRTLGRKARRPQGRRPAHQPQRDRARRLQGHRRTAVLHGPGRSDRAQHRLLRRLRRPQRGQGPQVPHRRGHHPEGAARPVVHHRPLRLATAKEFQEIKRQLEASGLFTITLHGRPWNTYVEGYEKGEYPVFGRGWSPDFPDPDNFVAPFVGKQNALGTPYPSPEITDKLLPQSRRESDRANVVKEFGQAQRILAGDARLLPLWQSKQYLASRDDISGAEQSLDPSSIMMMWELYRKTSW